MITTDQKLFYGSLFSNFKHYIEVREISKEGKSKPHFFTYKELLNYIMPTDKNIYVGIYERRHKGNGTTKSCTKTNAIYLDFDNAELEEIMFRIDMKKIPQPSMVVNSGHGYHFYWLLNKPAGHEIKPIVDRLAKVLEADPKATDTARVLRIPDTMNVKDVPVKSTLVKFNDNKVNVQQFESILGVKARIEIKERTGAIRELLNVKFNGLNNMAYGVKRGERNFCTGRIVQTLKRLNYTKQETIDVIFRWNTLNSPEKDTKELRKDINVFWHDERYKYDGKDFTDDRLQELNERFIDDDTLYFKGVGESLHSYDNELLRPDNFKKTRGVTFAILSIVKLAEDEGIRREHIADLCKRNAHDKMLRNSLNLLERMKYIKIIKKNRVNYYVFNEKANYNRGYTLVGKSLHRSYIHGELNEPEYKLMILLESYAFDNKKEIYPSNQTLSLRTGQSNSTIQRNLRKLRHKQFIKTEIKKGKRYIRLIYR